MPQRMPQVMSTSRSEMAKILRSLWNMVLEFLLKRKTMAPPLMTMPESMKTRMKMWVGVQLRARLSTIICIQGFEFIFGEKCPVSGNEVEMKDKSFALLVLLLSFFQFTS